MSNRWISLAVAVLATSACSSGRQPANRFEVQSRNYLDAAYDRMLGGRDYRLDREITGSLRDGNSETFDIRLEGGRAHAILGACDDDCDDMDLFLVDDDGNEIDSDVSTDSFPIVRYSPRRGGDYRLRVRMYDCNRNPCFYAVGIYSRDR